MTRILEAIYEDGVLRPLEDPGLSEHERVLLEVRGAAEVEARGALRAWEQVYDGLTEEEIQDVAEIALDRSRFSRSTA